MSTTFSFHYLLQNENKFFCVITNNLEKKFQWRLIFIFKLNTLPTDMNIKISGKLKERKQEDLTNL